MATQRKLSYEEFAADPRAAFASLERGDETEVVVECAGHLYRISPRPVDADLTETEVERARQALRESAGALRGVDTNALKARLKAERIQAPRKHRTIR